MTPDTKSITQCGSCHGDWSPDAEECVRCAVRFGCRAKTLETKENGPNVPKSAFDLFLSAMREGGFYFFNTSQKEECILILFSRSGFAVYVAYGYNGVLEAKVHGKSFDLGVADTAAFPSYVEKIARYTDEGI
jgi:hypothetical protein